MSKLIVIEGGDASGKETQTNLLYEQLKTEGIAVEKLDFPRYQDNQTGQLIRECLEGKHGDFINLDPRLASILYATDRRESLPEINEWLEDGKVVILDRYTSANMLHQGAKLTDDKTRNDVLSFIYNLEHEIMDLPVPDALVYLSVPAAIRLELLQNKQTEKGIAPDVAEIDAKHQALVDTAASAMLAMYPNSTIIECMAGNKLLSKEIIASKVLEVVRDIII